MNKALLSLVALGTLVTGSMAVGSDTGFRCGTRLVAVGDHMNEVRRNCGEPDTTNERRETRKVKVKHRRFINGTVEEISEEREVEIRIDEWVYDLGPRRFVRHVAFENGRVTGVSAAGYGSREDRQR